LKQRCRTEARLYLLGTPRPRNKLLMRICSSIPEYSLHFVRLCGHRDQPDTGYAAFRQFEFCICIESGDMPCAASCAGCVIVVCVSINDSKCDRLGLGWLFSIFLAAVLRPQYQHLTATAFGWVCGVVGLPQSDTNIGEAVKDACICVLHRRTSLISGVVLHRSDPYPLMIPKINDAGRKK
jgi:hypothetical protein